MADQIEMAIIHMSGVYLAQDFYRKSFGCPDEAGPGSVKVRKIDCRDIGGTRSYCDDQAKEQLRERIADAPFSGIHFLDSGNYHYISLLWMEKITEPFSLVLFDRHPDTQRPSFGDITSCGGWVREALLNNPYLEHVYLVGTDPKLLEQEGILTGVTGSGEKVDFPVKRVHVGLSELLERDRAGENRRDGETRETVYLSIDKDALCRQDARCDWDQGEMTLGELFSLMEQIVSCCRVIGADVCGENPDGESRGDFNGGTGGGEDAVINNRTNRRLAEKLLECMSASC